MTSAMTQPPQTHMKVSNKIRAWIGSQKNKTYLNQRYLARYNTRRWLRIRPAPTQKWAAATYLPIGTTKKEVRKDTTTKNRSHKPQIYTTTSPGCFILCTLGDKSMVCQKRPKLSPGCRIPWGVWFLMYG